jgi:Protein of unknown function (DUF3048) C-terminal domain
VFKEYVRKAALVDVGVENFPDRYHRDGGRPSPNNLFSSTPSLAALASPGAPGPPALFAYRPAGEGVSGAGAKPVGRAEGYWTRNGRPVTNVSYDWDPGAGRGTGAWLRIQNGELHVDAAGRRVSPVNVIFQFTTYHNTGLVDSSGAEVPEADVVGDGEAWVLTGGYLIPARWSKHSKEEITRYVDGAGHEVRLAPGRTWVELVPPGNGRFTERAGEPVPVTPPPAPEQPPGPPDGQPAPPPGGENPPPETPPSTEPPAPVETPAPTPVPPPETPPSTEPPPESPPSTQPPPPAPTPVPPPETPPAPPAPSGASSFPAATLLVLAALRRPARSVWRRRCFWRSSPR